MKKIFNEDYFIGLDVGTSSVGWAVTNRQYVIPSFNNKPMWGTVRFEEAMNAKTRRLYRCNSRRMERKKTRLKLLEMIFAPVISEVNMEFFQRLANSSYFPEDKSVVGKYSFFNDRKFTDNQYFDAYPTIYHLRKELMENKKPHDVRLVYLAIHHIIKHRGHFLIQEDFTNVKEIKIQPLANELIDTVSEYLNLNIEIADMEELATVLKENNVRDDKKKALRKLLLLGEEDDTDIAKKNKDCLEEIIKLLADSKAKLNKLYKDDSLKEEKSFSFSDNYDEKEEEFIEKLGEKYHVLEIVKRIYDWGILQNLLKGESSLSAAEVSQYNQHEHDLELLKNAVKESYEKDYDFIFGEPLKKDHYNYSAYVGRYNVLTENERLVKADCKKCSRADFIGFLKKFFNIDKEDGKNLELPFRIQYPELYKKIFLGTILPKQKVKENSIIPYQLHKSELKIILENASAYLPFLKEVDADGYNNVEKIMSLLTFRLPYYVGPINTYHQKNAWALRINDNNQKAYPWNMDKVIDYEASAERFIRRMTNKCSYLPTEDVLPKMSILYSKYTVLNEINNIRINGNKLPVEIKQLIFNKIFLKYKNVSQSKIINFLISEGLLTKDKENAPLIDGIDKKCNSNMGSYLDFAKIFNGGKVLSDSQIAIAEECIVNIVLFGGDKKMLKKRLYRLYENILPKEQIEKISKLKYSGWGRLSAKFLTEIKEDVPNLEGKISIIDALYSADTNPNLMQLLSNDYDYSKTIEKYNYKFIKDKDLDEILDDLYVSPVAKRSINKTIGVVRELVKILGKDPKKIFIEMARGPEDDKKRTVSRKDKILKNYNAIIKSKDGLYKDEIADLKDILSSKEDSALRGDKLYLYYMQMGRCMYSGEKIDLNELDSKYDIDHIYPQSAVKDDSLSNRVLVKKVINGAKSDIYPIRSEIRNNKKVRALWDFLLRAELIDKEKYHRLIRNTPFSLGELEGFINRQLVETRQSTKALAQILQKLYPNTRIVYVKAGNVSDFRQGIIDLAYDEETKKHCTEEVRRARILGNRMLKCREINDLHHAKDAYLNIVVGNVYNTKFTDNPRNFLKNTVTKRTYPYSLNAMYRFSCKNAWQPSTIDEQGNIVEGTMQIVKKYMSRNNPIVVQASYERNGKFFDLNPLKRDDKLACFPLKAKAPYNNIEKYGGYGRIYISYFVLVEAGEGKKRKVSIESIPIYKKDTINNKEDLIKYLAEELKLVNPRVIIDRLNVGTLVERNGFRMYLKSRSDVSILFANANQLIIDDKLVGYLKRVIKEADRYNGTKTKEKFVVRDYISLEENLMIYDHLVNKFNRKPYSIEYNKPGKKGQSIYERLVEYRDKFQARTLVDQVCVLKILLGVFNSSTTGVDLSKYGLTSGFGRIKMSKNISTKDKWKIIYTSKTGLFENIYTVDEL